VRWGIAGAAIIALYFLAVEPMLDSLNKSAGSAEADELAVREYARSGGRLRSARASRWASDDTALSRCRAIHRAVPARSTRLWTQC
jgi:hypothetical protein